MSKYRKKPVVIEAAMFDGERVGQPNALDASPSHPYPTQHEDGFREDGRRIDRDERWCRY